MVESMAQLNIREFDSKLMAKLKAKAALANKTLRVYVTELLWAAVRQ